MNQEYYQKSLTALQAELAHDTKVINGLKKALKKLQSDDWKPLDSLEEVMAERESKMDFLKRTIKKIEDALNSNS
jgi:bacterioferritin (cytochrome b1)